MVESWDISVAWSASRIARDACESDWLKTEPHQILQREGYLYRTIVYSYCDSYCNYTNIRTKIRAKIRITDLLPLSDSGPVRLSRDSGLSEDRLVQYLRTSAVEMERIVSQHQTCTHC